jgi:hypothetical protein
VRSGKYEERYRITVAMKTPGEIPTEYGLKFHGLQTWRMNGHAGDDHR